MAEFKTKNSLRKVNRAHWDSSRGFLRALSSFLTLFCPFGEEGMTYGRVVRGEKNVMGIVLYVFVFHFSHYYRDSDKILNYQNPEYFKTPK